MKLRITILFLFFIWNSKHNKLITINPYVAVSTQDAPAGSPVFDKIRDRIKLIIGVVNISKVRSRLKITQELIDLERMRLIRIIDKNKPTTLNQR
jgi:hypothetical protein